MNFIKKFFSVKRLADNLFSKNTTQKDNKENKKVILNYRQYKKQSDEYEDAKKSVITNMKVSYKFSMSKGYVSFDVDGYLDHPSPKVKTEIKNKIEKYLKRRYYMIHPVIQSFQEEIKGACRTDKLEAFLKQGADPNFPIYQLDFSDMREDEYPVHYAVQKGNIEAVDLLLKYGALLNQPGSSVLNWVADSDYDMAKHLLEKGAQFYYSNMGGCYAMYKAITKNDIKMVSLFMAYGYNEKKDIVIPLETAAEYNLSDMIDFLENNYPQSQQNRSRALIQTAFNGAYEAAQQLLKRKVDVNYKYEGCTPLQALLCMPAALFGKNKADIIKNKGKIAQMLVDAGADTQSVNLYSLLTSFVNSFKMAKILIDNGAEFDLIRLPKVEKSLQEELHKELNVIFPNKEEAQKAFEAAQQRNRRVIAYALYYDMYRKKQWKSSSVKNAAEMMPYCCQYLNLHQAKNAYKAYKSQLDQITQKITANIIKQKQSQKHRQRC